jgi:hypothetical protein
MSTCDSILQSAIGLEEIELYFLVCREPDVKAKDGEGRNRKRLEILAQISGQTASVTLQQKGRRAEADAERVNQLIVGST